MGWILDQFHDIQARLRGVVASSDHDFPPPSKKPRIVESSHHAVPALAEEEGPGASSLSTIPVARPPPEKINDNVHEVHKPTGRPLVELIFYHGLQLEGPDEAHLTTWLSGKGTDLWVNWLLNDFPDARILIVSYDADIRKTVERGRMDMYVTCENLLQNLLDAQVGQSGCPVILVGHCIGGLIMKEICVKAYRDSALNAFDRDHIQMQKLLHNVKGLFFYASPHHGSMLADSDMWFSKGPLFEGITTLNTEGARRNEDFRKLRRDYKWKAWGVGETCPINLGTFEGLVVAEASARQDMDNFCTVAADHFHVCRPESPESSSYRFLWNFVHDILEEDKARCHGHKIEFSTEVVGLEGQVSRVLETHKDTRRLGIVGMGGIGKTTLAKSLYNTISGSYEYTCFVPEVKKKITTDQESPDELRKEIIGRLYHQGRKVPSPFNWGTLKGKTVLIVLDDAESESQVLGISETDAFAEKSRVIVTTRNKRFLIPEKFECYHVKHLDKLHSEKLFCLHAFQQENTPAGYEEYVERFTSKCDGLPLALKVSGRCLYHRDKTLWDEAFVKLGRAQALEGDARDGLFSVLKVSIDLLAEPEREMFFDAATCFHGEDLAVVKRAWSVRWSANYGWDNLVDKSLVATEGGSIHVHEVLRDLGRSMTCPDPQNVAGHSRLFYHRSYEGVYRRCGEVVHDEVPPWLLNEGKSKAKVLRIWNDDHLCVMDVNFLREFEELRILWLNMASGKFRGECHKFPTTLLYLRVTHVEAWIDVSEESSSTQHLQQQQQQQQTLRHVEIFDSPLEALPRSLGQLSALRHLHIVDCYNLKALPDSLGELQALETLHVENCCNLKSLPYSTILLRALKRLYIQGLARLQTLPSNFGRLEALTHLHLEDCADFKTLLDSLVLLQALKSLHIQGLARLQTLPNNFGRLDALTHLHLEDCGNLKPLPTSIALLHGLEHLSIQGCPRCIILPASLCQYRSLKHVVLDDPATIPIITNRTLCMYTSEDLKNLQNILQQLEDLEGCNTHQFPDFESIRITLGQFQDVKSLKIE